MKYNYEVVKKGQTPSFKATDSYLNPVSIGHKVKENHPGGDLLLVDDIEHYSNVSVLYVVNASN